jgi:hypothetical protein
MNPVTDPSRDAVRPALLDEMLDRLGIDDRVVRGSRFFAGAQRRCLRCTQTVLCGNWLAIAARPKAPPPFCPNASVLRRMMPEG